MEQVEINNSKRKFAFFFDAIKKLEGQIMENPSLIMSEYISTASENKTE